MQKRNEIEAKGTREICHETWSTTSKNGGPQLFQSRFGLPLAEMTLNDHFLRFEEKNFWMRLAVHLVAEKA